MLARAEGDAGLVQIVGGHFDLNLVADGDADEMFAHLAGDVREHFVTVGEGDAEHGSREHLGDRSSDFDVFFFRHAETSCRFRFRAGATGGHLRRRFAENSGA